MKKILVISNIHDKISMIIQLSRKKIRQLYLFIKSKPKILIFLKKTPYPSKIPIYTSYFFLKKSLIISIMLDKGYMIILLSKKIPSR